MFNDLNQCLFSGRLGADPEVRTFQNGGKVANLRLAVGESWKDKNTGERKERAEWVTVAVFNDGLVGLCERFLSKGSRVLVRGKMQSRKWQDQSGNDRYSTECVLQGFDAFIQLLDDKQGNSGGGDGWSQSGGSQSAPQGGGSNYDDLEDDIPF